MTSESNKTEILNQFLTGTLYSGVGTGLRIVSGVIATKILATYLSSSDFGYVILIEIIAAFLGMLSRFSIGIAAIRSLSHHNISQNHIVDTVVIFQLFSVVLVGLLFFVLQPWVFRLFGEEPIKNLSLIIFIFGFLLSFQSVLKSLLQGFFRFKQMAVIELGVSVLNVTLLVIFLIWFQSGFFGAVFANLLSVGSACILYYLSIPSKKGISFKVSTMKTLLSFSWPLQINEIFTFVFQSFGTIFVASVMTPTDVAMLAIATKIPNNVRRLYESFRTVYFPNLSNLILTGDYLSAQKVLNSTLRIISFIMVFVTGFIYVFQKELTLFFFSEQYLENSHIMVLASLSLSIGLIGNIMGNSTVAAGNSMAPPITNVINTVVTVVSNLIFVPVVGIAGAVISSILGRLITTPVNIWFVRKSELHPKIMDFVKPFALFITLSIIVGMLQPESWIGRFPFLIIYVVAGFFLSIVTKSEILTLWNVINIGLVKLFRKRSIQQEK
jgi:O-antigen/teichoic acid export membrane protein